MAANLSRKGIHNTQCVYSIPFELQDRQTSSHVAL
jgi:hypothetical protein